MAILHRGMPRTAESHRVQERGLVPTLLSDALDNNCGGWEKPGDMKMILKFEATSADAAITPDGKIAVLSVVTAGNENLAVSMAPELLERLQWRINDALSLRAAVEEN